MMKKQRKWWMCLAGGVASVATLLLVGCSQVPEQYAPSENGQLTIREIPAGRQIKTSMPGDYFSQDGALFGRLYAYLRKHNLTMTVPVVTTDGETCSMAFYVLPSEYDQAAVAEEEVEVVEVPEQTVAIWACRGNNTAETYSQGIADLQTALGAQGEYEIDGEFFATYWDAPMWPGFLRHYEIGVPVKKTAANR